MLPIDLSKKIALVTGATGELGRVMVRTLAKCGADIAIHYFNNRALAERLRTEVQTLGVRGFMVQGDITSARGVQAMRAAVVRALGHPQIIVNNAVIQYTWTNVLEQAPEDYESQFRSCVLQNVLMAQAFIPAMIKARYGRVIAISTECAMQNMPGQSAYVSGKRGMDGVLRVLAREVGPHQITVNQVAPGWMISDKQRGTAAERQPEYEERVPLRRRGHDQDIANVVAFLASDLANFISGAYIPVCGGNIMPAI
jgi:3-oxoacyl-[acyl-carrier protein] reductase